VARPWLLEWLSQHRQRPLTLVSASAGYGKTTLISSWLESVDSPSTWLSLDENDDDLIGFLTYFIAAIQTIFPEAGRETLALLTAPTLPPLPVLTRSLTNELAQLTDPLILVLDDYHVIREAAIHNLLSELLRYPSRAMHLVITTRSDPPLPIAKLRARAQVTEIRPYELRFKATETATLLQQMGIQADDDTAADLTEKTEGWVTGLRLATLSLRHRSDIDLLLQSMPENSRHVTDYLLAEVLNRLDPAIQDFLLKISILDRLCGPLCDAVAELDEPVCDGLAYLAWMQKHNLFTIPLDDQYYWYRYHHLFQQLLQHQLEMKLDTEAIAALHRRASRWYAENGFIDEALNHALKAEDISAAAQLVEQNGRTLLDEDKWYILEKWLAKLPDDIIQQRPRLLLAKAWILYYRLALWAFPPLLEATEAILDDDETTQPLWGEVDFFWGHHWYWQGETARSLDLFGRALERIPKTHHLGARGEAELYWGLAKQMSGQKNEAVQTLNEWVYHEQTPHPNRLIKDLGSLIFIYLLSGELTEAARVTQQVQDMVAKSNNAYVKAWVSYLLANVHYYWNDLENASRHLAKAVEYRYNLYSRTAIDSLAGLTLTCQALGQPDRAGDTMALLLEFARETNDPIYIDVARSCQAHLALLQGDMLSAGRWLQTADLTSNAPVMFYWLEIPQITQCRVLIAQETEASLRQAEELLQEYQQQNEAQHNTHKLIDILLLQALLHHKQEQFDEALATLERVVTLGQPGGFIRPFLETGPTLTPYLEKLRSQGITPDYITQILNAFDIGSREAIINESSQEKIQPSSLRQAQDKPLSPQPLIEPLTDRELEVLELLVQRFSNKEIATELVISPLTVKKHTVNIYQKLEVKNRRQAVSKATALGLVSDH
jgi:LuxR family maltose regulon positive regulatory protein